MSIILWIDPDCGMCDLQLFLRMGKIVLRLDKVDDTENKGDDDGDLGRPGRNSHSQGCIIYITGTLSLVGGRRNKLPVTRVQTRFLKGRERVATCSTASKNKKNTVSLPVLVG